jgi:signal transduction histidine kinase
MDPLSYVLSAWRGTAPDLERLERAVPVLVEAVERAGDLPRDGGPAVDAARRAARNALAGGAGAPAARTLRDLREALADMGEGLDRIGAALGDLRSLGIRERDSMRPVALGPVLDAALDVAVGMAKPGVAIEHDVPLLPPVRGHRWALAQAFVSLVLHALERVGPDGALRVVARSTGDRVHVELCVDPPLVEASGPLEAAGLAVAVEILELHDVRIEAVEPETALRLIFPVCGDGG